MPRSLTNDSGLSIWDSGPGSLSWYDHLVGNKNPEPFITSLSNLGEDDLVMPTWDHKEVEKELSYQGAWYNQLMAEDEKKSKKSRSKPKAVASTPIDPAPVKNDRKPKSKLPSFDYMFADDEPEEELKGSENSIDDLSYGKTSNDDDCMSLYEGYGSDASSPESFCPTTPGSPPYCPTSPTRPDFLPETTYDGRTLKEFAREALDSLASSSPDHDVDDRPLPPLPIPFDSTEEDVSDVPQPMEAEQKLTLKPKSQKSKLERCEMRPVEEGFDQYPAGKVSKTPSVEIVKVTKKRDAQETFGAEQDDSDDDEVQYICTKKARHLEDQMDDTGVIAESAEMPDTSSVVDLTMTSDTSSDRKLSTNFLTRKPLAVPPKGYAGQFDGLVIDRSGLAKLKHTNPDFWLPKSIHNHHFGTLLHPNGLFTHTALAIDPWNYTPDLTEEQVSEGHPMLACIRYAQDMTIAAAHPNIVTLRNQDEESVRREAHFECAMARLEGVPVGYYRYYQGHLSLDEYNAAEMCICWGPCSCTKMCTRFGDIKCPCAKDIVVHEA